jgi:ATP phosphoribosyltransferase regulatory subunit
VRFFDGDELVALRWDFTEALARTLVRRFQEPPRRISYAGPVFRRPANSWDPVERLEVGCEHIQADPDQRTEADRELARLLMAVPALLGLEGCLLHIGHAALLRRPMEAEGIPAELGQEVARVLDRRAIHRAAELLDGHPARARLLAHAEILLSGPDGPGSLADLARGPYGALLETEAEQLGRVLSALSAQLPQGLTLRLDLGDLRGLGYYSGPTLRLWAPGAQRELAAGGRYDGLYPEMGRPWYAAGFCVRLTTLLELGDNDQGEK